MNLESSFIDTLISIVGKNNVILQNTLLEQYGRDYTEDLFFVPGCVVLPETPESVAAVLHWCNENRVAVYTRGAGTGLSGGCLPVKGGVVLSTEKLNRIIEIDRDNFQATVQPGVIN